MAGVQAENKPFVIDGFELERKKWPFPGRMGDGARASFIRAGSLMRLNWLTVVDLDPRNIPWASENGDRGAAQTGRASVVGARYAAMVAAGELNSNAREIALREWDGQVQISGGFEQGGLFEWGDDNMFKAAVFAESTEGRVAMGVRNGSRLTIPQGVVLMDQLPPKDLPQSHPGLHLAA